jgi:hypothetical protein
MKGRARIYAVATEFVSHTDGQIDDTLLKHALEASKGFADGAILDNASARTRHVGYYLLGDGMRRLPDVQKGTEKFIPLIKSVVKSRPMLGDGNKVWELFDLINPRQSYRQL